MCNDVIEKGNCDQISDKCSVCEATGHAFALGIVAPGPG